MKTTKPEQHHLRIARPTDRLRQVAMMYEQGLGFEVLGRFEDHDGFDGVILGKPGGAYHLEFVSKRGEPAGRAPTEDNLLVFYVSDRAEWLAVCARMIAAGFRPVPSYNPYWDVSGRTFEDPDGYRVVIEGRAWTVR